MNIGEYRGYSKSSIKKEVAEGASFEPLFLNYKKEVIQMIDLTNRTIKRLFEKQVLDMTRKTLIDREESFDYQLSGGWIR